MFSRPLEFLDSMTQIIKLPVAHLQFDRRHNPGEVVSTYNNYTKPHPRYRVIRNKSIGVALVDLRRYRDRQEYVEQFKGKGQATFHAKRASARGYVVRLIDMNDHIDAIHHINTSLASRQGRPMPDSYLIKQCHFESISNYQYHGVLNKDGTLVAYCSIAIYGNFAAFSQCLGHRNNDGCMQLMLAEVICQLIDVSNINFVMYDTWFGGQPGLRQFKASFGFQPYRAVYTLI
jgi:hypothetical protein